MEEKEIFLKRVVKHPLGCWEFRRPDGSEYPENASPLWGKNEAVRHAAVRLLGEELLGKIQRGWRVLSRATCLKWCVNPLHLKIQAVDRKDWQQVEIPRSKPPGFVLGEGPSPVYVQDRRVLPALLDEADLPPSKPKVNRPGFAGKHGITLGDIREMQRQDKEAQERGTDTEV